MWRPRRTVPIRPVLCWLPETWLVDESSDSHPTLVKQANSLICEETCAYFNTLKDQEAISVQIIGTMASKGRLRLRVPSCHT